MFGGAIVWKIAELKAVGEKCLVNGYNRFGH